MMQGKFDELLEKHSLKKTSPRFRVLEVLSNRNVATSQPNLEDILGKEVDRVTLYRILKTFEEKGIIHKIIDSNGTANYAVCHSSCTEHQHRDEHLHFNCTVCKNVYCLNDVHIPNVILPGGFEASTINLIATGICPGCKAASE